MRNFCLIYLRIFVVTYLLELPVGFWRLGPGLHSLCWTPQTLKLINSSQRHYLEEISKLLPPPKKKNMRKIRISINLLIYWLEQSLFCWLVDFKNISPLDSLTHLLYAMHLTTHWLIDSMFISTWLTDTLTQCISPLDSLTDCISPLDSLTQ